MGAAWAHREERPAPAPEPAPPRVPPVLVEHARRQGERAGRWGAGPETNPFTVDDKAARAWEAARSLEAEGQLALKLEAKHG